MNARRLIGILSMTAMVLLMSGFGTEVWGTTYYWTGPDPRYSNYDWSTAANWYPSGVPDDASDEAIFAPVYFNGSSNVTVNYWTVQILSAGITVGTLTIQNLGGSPTQNAVTLLANGTLTVSTLATLQSNAQLDVQGNATVAIQFNGNVNLSAGSGGLTTQIYSTPGSVRINLGSSSYLTMGDVSTSYFGLGVRSFLSRSTGAFGSAVRFDDDFTFDGTGNLLLGAHNLYLGKNCTLTTPIIAGGLPGTLGSQSGYIGFSSGGNTPNYTGTGIGYICRQVDPTDQTSWGPWFFPVAPIDGDRSGKYAPVQAQILSAVGWTSTATPWPHIAVRAMGYKHPANQQTSPELHLYWVIKGVGTPGEGNPGLMCTKVIMWYVNYYKTNGPDNQVYSACYTDNYGEATHYNTPGWDVAGSLINASTSSSDEVPYGSSTVCIPHFGDYTIGFGDPNGDPVPVELTSFSARYLDGQVRLNWQTATELNNFGFAIERSTDGEGWEEVGFVNGHGTTFSPKSYEHVDLLPPGLARLPQLAYRLRQMDRDGTTEYSNIVFVKTGELPEGIELYAAYPNPFNPATTISFAISEPANVTLKVYNTLGQVVATLLTGSAMDAGLHTVPFSGEQLPSGIYMAVLEADGAQQHQKLVLNK